MQFSGEFLLINNQIERCSAFDFNKANSAKAIYEVIRMVDGVPLFLEDHINRLRDAADALGVVVNFSDRGIAFQMLQMAEKNNISVGNIKIIVEIPENIESTKIKILLFFIPHHYPTQAEYAKGISLHTLMLERPNPNIKIIRSSIEEKVLETKRIEKVDEILLVRHDAIVTEGSKSNIFFVEDDKVITSKRAYVLPGITREKVIRLCEILNIECEERVITIKDLETFEVAFITGTSPKILPVNRIDNHHLQLRHPIIEKLRVAYDEEIIRYVANFNITNLPD